MPHFYQGNFHVLSFLEGVEVLVRGGSELMVVDVVVVVVHVGFTVVPGQLVDLCVLETFFVDGGFVGVPEIEESVRALLALGQMGSVHFQSLQMRVVAIFNVQN